MIAAELRGGNQPSLNEALSWIGTRVDDIYGASVGRLEDVWIDPGTGAPRWLLVKEGRFGGRTTLIPFEDATAGAGHVWVAYEREIVGAAPEVEPGAPLTHQMEAALRSHYSSRSATGGELRPEGTGVTPPTVQRRGTTTIRIHGSPADDEPLDPSPHNFAPPPAEPYVSPAQADPYALPREDPHVPQRRTITGEPSYNLPPRPAPPIAAPSGPHRYREPHHHPAPDPYSEPEPYVPSEPYRYRESRPSAEPGYGPPRQGRPGVDGPLPPQRGAAAPAPRDPLGSLHSLANAPGVHYVEIELTGELSIRGELRSVRVVPRPEG